MVRIPTVEDFSPRRDFGVDRDVRVTPTRANISNAGAPGAAVAGLGRAISGVGSDLQGIADKQKAEQEQLNAFNATTGFYNTTGAVNRELDERMKSAPADGSGVDKMFGEVFDKNFGAYLAGITDPKLRARKEADVAQARAQYEARGRSTMEGLRTNHYTGEINRFGTSAVNGLQQNPEAWDTTNAGLGQIIAQSGLPPEAKSRIIEQWEPKLIQGRIDGYHRLADQAERDGRIDEAKALRDKASTFATEMDRQQAARAGVTQAMPGGGGTARRAEGLSRRAPQVSAILDDLAAKHGLDPNLLKAYADIESSGDPRNVTGSYKGLFQLSDEEMAKYGGGGDIFDPRANAEAGIRILKERAADFQKEFGRPPTATELYLMHQQGAAGLAAHMRNPNQPAWQSMLSTAEGRQKGEKWAKLAIWGNIPSDMKAQFGSVENVTSAQFMNVWQRKVEGSGGTGTYATYSSAMDQQSEARLRQEQVRIRAADKERHDAYVNQVEFGIHDGTYGIANLVQDRQNGIITDADEYLKLKKRIDDRDGDVNLLNDAIDKIQGGQKDYVFDPMDKDDKKAVELYSNALNVGKNLGKRDTQAVAQAAAILDRSGMIPKDVQGPLQALYKSQDVGAFNFGMQAMRNLYERNPEIFTRTFGEKIAQYVGGFAVTSGYNTPEQSFELLKKDSDPAVQANKDKLRQSADKLLKDGGITAASIPEIFSQNLDLTGPASRDLGAPDRDGWQGGPPLSTAQSGLLAEDYRRLFRENYALVNGDEDAAKKLTVQQMQRIWGETAVHGPGGGAIWLGIGTRDRIMRNPPERYYQPVNGSYDWMRKEVEGHVKTALPGATDWEMVALPETLADIKAGTAPRYGVQVRDQSGAWIDLRGPDNRPVAIRFDPKGLGPPQPGVAAKAAEAARAQAATHDANAGVSVAGGNPFALTEQEKAPAGPEMNEAVRRRRGAAGAPIVPE